MFNTIVITNKNTKLSKYLDINSYTIKELGIIIKFYKEHKNFIIDRIKV